MKTIRDFLIGTTLCIPMLCVVAWWLFEDWIKGRKIGQMDV